MAANFVQWRLADLFLRVILIYNDVMYRMQKNREKLVTRDADDVDENNEKSGQQK